MNTNLQVDRRALFLIKAMLCSSLCLGLNQSRAADEVNATNVLGNLLKDKYPRLASIKPSASKQFSFDVLFLPKDRTTREQMSPTIMEMAVDNDDAVIVTKTTNGYPHSIMMGGRLIILEPNKPGTIMHRDGGAMLWGFFNTGEATNTFRFIQSYLGVEGPPNIDLNLGGLVEKILPLKRDLSYDEETHVLKWVSTMAGSSLELTLSTNTLNRFGVDAFSLVTTNVEIRVSNIRVGRESILKRRLANASKEALDEIGLPRHLLTGTEYGALHVLVPPGFPKEGAEMKAATRLREWLKRKLGDSPGDAKIPE